MTCPWRKLEADGRVEECCGYGLQHGNDYAAATQHTSSGSDFETVGWGEDDPGAWDGTCPDCGGRKWANRDPARKHGKNTPCPRCGGAGTVDTIPPRLVGPGSVLGKSNDVDARFIVTPRHVGRMLGRDQPQRRPRRPHPVTVGAALASASACGPPSSRSPSMSVTITLEGGPADGMTLALPLTSYPQTYTLRQQLGTGPESVPVVYERTGEFSRDAVAVYRHQPDGAADG